MSESPNLNINNYSIEELLNILDINYPINEEQLLEHGKGYIEKYIAENQPEFAAFFAKALEKLINDFEEIDAILDPPKITEDQYAENILQNQYYDDGSEVQQKASKIPNRSNNVSVINDQHSIQSQGRIYPINDTRVVPLAQGRLNPILKNTYTSLLNIDSHYREIITNSNSTSCDFNSTSTAITILDTSTDFTFNLTEDIPEVVSMTVGSLELPMNAYYPISDKYGTNFFKIEKDGESCCLTLPAGFYPNVAPTSDTSNGIWNYQSYESDNIPNDLRGWNLQSIINYNISQCTFGDMNLFGINLKPMFYNLTIPNRIRVNLKPQFAFKQGYEARIENIHTMKISNDVTIKINPQIIIPNRQFVILEFPDITYVNLKTDQDLSGAELSGFYIQDSSGASVGAQAYLGNATDPSDCLLAETIKTIDASGGYWGQKQPVTRRIKLKDVSGVIFDNTANIGLKIPITGSAVLDISYTDISGILDIQRELGKTDLNTQVKQGYRTWLSQNIKFYNSCEVDGNDIDNPIGNDCYQQYWKYDISFSETINFTDASGQGKLVKYARIWQEDSNDTKIEGVVLEWDGSSDGLTANNITVGVGYQDSSWNTISPPYLFNDLSSVYVKVGNDSNDLANQSSWDSGNFIIHDASINPISDNALVVTAKGKVSYWDWEYQTYTRMYIQQEFTDTDPFIFGEKIWIEGLKYGLGGRADKGERYMIWENGSTFPFDTWSPIETVTAEGKIVGWDTSNHPYKVPSIAIELTTVGTFDTQKPISFTNTSGIADFTISDVSNVRFSQDIVHKRGDKIKQGDVTGTLVTDQINPSFKIYVTDISGIFELPIDESDPSGVKPFIIEEVDENGGLTGRETTIIPVYKNNPIDEFQYYITAAVGNTVTQIIPNPPGSDPANTIISGTLKTALIQGDKGKTGVMVNSVIETQNETDQFVDTENIIIVDDNGSSIIFAVKSGGISSPADITAPAGTIVTQGASIGTMKYSVVPPGSTFIITAANGQTFNNTEGMNIGTTFIESTTIESVVALQNFSQSAGSRIIQFQSVGTLMCSVQNPVEEVVISYDGPDENIFSTTGGNLQIGTTVIPQEYILDVSNPLPFDISGTIPAGTAIGQGSLIGRLQKAITKDSVEIILTYENIAANNNDFNLNINFIIGNQLVPPNTFACIESVKNPIGEPIGSAVTQGVNQGTLYIVEPTIISSDGTVAHASIIIELSQGTFSAGGITIISNGESAFYLTTTSVDTTYPPIFDPQKQLANINDTVTQKNISSSVLALSMTGDTSEILIKVQPDVVITSTNDITIISTATAKTFTIEAVFISSSTAQYQRFSAPQFSTVVQDGSIGKVQKGVDNTDAGPNPRAVSRIVISGEENSSFSADEDIVLSNNTIIEGRYISSVTVFSGLQMVITPNTQKTSFINNTGSEITLTFYSNNCDTDECFPTDKCLMGNRGAKIDSNLGWLLGFRQPKYVIQPGSFITSEATVNPWGTRYLLLEVDDLNRNRNTGNLISMSSKKDKLKLPEYYKKTQELYPACPPDPCSDISGINFKISKLPQKASYQKRSSRKGVPAGTLLIDGSNNLTKAQKYTITEIMNRRKKQNQIRYNAPVNTNILYRAPLQRNSSNILSGNAVPLIVKNDAGSETARRYFGPIILKTLKIKLLNDKGYPIDLRADWSCDLKIERKYQF